MRMMKDSGIEWIGEIPQEWNVCRIKTLFEIIGGNGFKEHLQGNESGDYPFYKVSDINGDSIHSGRAANYISSLTAKEYAFNLVPPKAIIMSKIGEALKKNHRKISNTDCFIDNNLQALVPNADIDEVFYYYVLCCVNMEWFDNGGTIPSVNNQKLRDFKLPLPAKAQQVSIGHCILQKCTEIDALIATKEKINVLLKERRQSIIYEAVTKGLNPDASMKDSGIEWIGQIPEKWNTVCLKRLGMASTGSTPSKDHPEYWDGDIPWVSPKDMKTDYLADSEDHITEAAVSECGLTVFDENTLLFCVRSGILRHTFPVCVTKQSVTINQDLRAMTLTKNVLPSYLLYYLRGINDVIVTLYQKVGATVESIEMDWFIYLPVVLPSIIEQAEIANYLKEQCERIDAIILKNDETIAKLKEYRQSLIYEAVTGKIEV